MHFTTSALVAAASFALTANAHLFISSPQPIAGTNPKDPLEASGSNFPCHGVNLPSSGGQKMAAGSSQILSFDDGGGANTAVHGGGSCQLSLTYETDPAKVKDPSNWKVIYSIEGGCPSNTYQNLDGSYTGPQGAYSGALQCSDPKANGVDCINSFNFTIPQGVQNGHATLAWTWFNNVGNRELYMNCVSAEITGGDSSEMNELPGMFVANMADINSCPTTESVAVKFPNAGKYVMTKLAEGQYANKAQTFPIAMPTGSGCDQGAPGGGSPAPAPSQTYGGSSPSANPGSSAPAYGQPSQSAPAGGQPSQSAPAYGQPSQPAQPSQGGGNGGGSYGGGGANGSPGGAVTVTTMRTVTGSSAAASGAPSAPAYSAPAGGSSAAAGGSSAAAGGSSVAPYPPAGSGSSSSGACSDGKVACTNPGGVVCMGNSQFGLCDIDGCAVPRPVAAGTHCEGDLSGGYRVQKRSHMRHVRQHAAHRH